MHPWNPFAPCCTWGNSDPENLSPFPGILNSEQRTGKGERNQKKMLADNIGKQRIIIINIYNGYFGVGVGAAPEPMNGWFFTK